MSSFDDGLFPTITRNIQDFIEDEEGSIPANGLLMLGAMIIVLGAFAVPDAYAAHRSHSSHKSHSSHSSSASGHSNHASHESHSSHASHTSHSNTSMHSNSQYSNESDATYRAPAASAVPGVRDLPAPSPDGVLTLPDVNENIENPSGTPGSNILPTFSVPATTAAVKIDAGNFNYPSQTGVAR